MGGLPSGLLSLYVSLQTTLERARRVSILDTQYFHSTTPVLTENSNRLIAGNISSQDSVLRVAEGFNRYSPVVERGWGTGAVLVGSAAGC